MKSPATKTAIVLRGWKEEHFVKELEGRGYNVLALDYKNLPIKVTEDPKHGTVISVSDSPLLKNGKPAIAATKSNGRKVEIDKDTLVPLEDVDLVVTRIFGRPQKGIDILKLLEQYGVTSSESVEAHITAMSKSNSATAFEEFGLTIPETLFLSHEEPEASIDMAKKFFDSVEGVVSKPDDGDRGNGVTFPTSKAQLENDLLTLFAKKKDIVVQQQIHAKDCPHHYRVVVVDGEIMATKKFTAAKGELLTNLAKGATHKDAVLSKKQRDFAIKAAKSVGVNLAGVDLIESEDGKTYLLEVNMTPAIKSLTPDERKAVTSRIVNLMEQQRYKWRSKISDEKSAKSVRQLNS